MTIDERNRALGKLETISLGTYDTQIDFHDALVIYDLICDLRVRLRQSQIRADAAVRDMRELANFGLDACDCCAYRNLGCPTVDDCFEWRGVCEENMKEYDC